MSQRLTVSQYVSNPVGQFYAAATGGASTSQITSYGKRYTLHTFTSSSDLTVGSDGFIDVIAVGAGGGVTSGANLGGGGGGGGQVLFVERLFVSAGTYPVVIGAGVSAFFGQKTFIKHPMGALLVVGSGGIYGTYTQPPESYGASGGGGGGRYGGGGYGGGAVPGGTGYRGGDATTSGGSGGGGGAGAAGSNAAGGVGGAGGAGLDISLLLGESATTTYKGGGGGGHGTGGIGANGSGTGANNTGGGAQTDSETAKTGWSGILYVRSAPQ